MFIKIKPLDTLFFRTSRPFSAGEETWTDYIFPPFPRTLYGALRTYLIFEKGTLEDFIQGKLEQDLGTVNKYGTFTLKGPFLLENNEVIYFKTPLDTVILDKKIKFLKLIQKPTVMISDFKLENILFSQFSQKPDDPRGWISIENLINYLSGRDDFEYLEESHFYVREEKIGIKRNRKTFTAEEGHLYRTFFTRMKENLYLGTKIEGINSINDQGIFQLGGERKSAYFQKINEDPLNKLREFNIKLSNEFFKIYLVTPAIFNNGWLPSWINQNTLEGEYQNIKLKLIACAIGRYQFIGGWDLAKENQIKNQTYEKVWEAQKPLKKAIPAGSVYFFKILNGSAEDVKKALHFQNISDESSQEGFGLTLIGEVKI